MKKNIYMLIAGLILISIPTMAQSASVTNTFTGTVYDGPFTGHTGIGSFTYDDILLQNGNEEISPVEGLLVTFSFDGQTFDESNDIDFTAYPLLSFDNFVPISLDYILQDNINSVDFYDPNLAELSMFSLIPSSGDYDFDIEIHASSVPIPGAIWLLVSGLAGLVGIRIKRNKK